VRPFGSRMRPPPLQHAPVRARARYWTRPRPDTCPHRNGCAQIAFRPRKNTVFAPGPTRPCPFTRDCARRVYARSGRRAKSPRPVPRVHARSHASAPGVCARSHASAPGVRARPHQSAPGLTRPRPLALVRAQCSCAFTSGRTRATSARPQSFPASAPCSRMRPQHYINPFAPLHKSLYS
jgi:hypothetical protein